MDGRPGRAWKLSVPFITYTSERNKRSPQPYTFRGNLYGPGNVFVATMVELMYGERVGRGSSKNLNF